MKTFIFCGGYGTRLNKGKPGPLKPLVKINGMPIIEHIFNIYGKYGFKDFYLLGGYKFNELLRFAKKIKKFNINVINSGVGTTTAGRLLYAKEILEKEERFFLTYGDSLANFKPIKALKIKTSKNFVISTHNYKPPYGVITADRNSLIKKIFEKNFTLNINAGFYVLDFRIFDYIKSKNESFELHTMPRILKKIKNIKSLNLKKWHPIDNIYDIESVEKLLKSNNRHFNV